jgi:hypothetical protein
MINKRILKMSLLFISLPLTAYSQLLVLPSGTGAGAGPVDHLGGSGSVCRSVDGDCSFKIEYRASCFGINIRNTPGNAIGPSSQIKTDITVSNGKNTFNFKLSKTGSALQSPGRDIVVDPATKHSYVYSRSGILHTYIFSDPITTKGIIPNAIGVRKGKVVYDSNIKPTVNIVTNPRVATKSYFGEGGDRNILYIEATWPSYARGFCGSFKSPLMLFFDDQRPEFTGKSSFSLQPDVNDDTRVYWPEAHAPGYFLALNLVEKRIIFNGDHLFGDSQGHANGFEKLKSFDLNNDGVIDKKDEVFTQLVLWRDLNGDGVAQDDEIFTLSELGVVKINLNYDNRATTYNQNKVFSNETSTFVFEEDGVLHEGLVEDIWFENVQDEDAD